MTNEITHNVMQGAVAVGSGELLDLIVFMSCFTVSSIVTFFIVIRIPFQTLDGFFNRLSLNVNLFVKGTFSKCMAIPNFFQCGKIFFVQNPLKPVSQKGADQRAQNGSTNASEEKLVCHSGVVRSNDKS